MKEPILVVMAAGIGSRYGGLKQMDPIGRNGEKIIDYSVYDAKEAGFKRVIFIINPQIEEDFKKLIGNKIAEDMSVGYAIQRIDDVPIVLPEGRIKPWGTGHAVYSARHLIDAPFAVINADDFYGKEGYGKLYQFLTNDVTEDHYAMVGFYLKNTVTDHGYVSRGVCKVKDHKLTDVVERVQIEKRDGIQYHESGGWHDLEDDAIVSMNMWGFHHKVLDLIEALMPDYLTQGIKENPLKCEFFLPYVIDQAIGRGVSVSVLETKEQWYGVTYKADKAQVKEAIDRKIELGQYHDPLWGA